MSNNRNHCIEGYRGLLILYIILFHYTYRFDALFPEHAINSPFIFSRGAIIGNSIFFLLSGYFTSHSILKGNIGAKSCGYYIINKYWRLWPQYAISVLIIFGISNLLPLNGRNVTIEDAIINFFLIFHPNIPYVDGAHWFISDLILFQILVGFVIFLKYNSRIWTLRLLIVIPFAIFVIYHFNLTEIDKEVFKFFCRYFYSFLFGIYIGVYKERIVLISVLL